VNFGGNILEKNVAKSFGRYFSEKNAPNAKKIAQMAKSRPIWSHCPRATAASVQPPSALNPKCGQMVLKALFVFDNVRYETHPS
jgi:hypothetical protein